jgi:hypothetical protein
MAFITTLYLVPLILIKPGLFRWSKTAPTPEGKVVGARPTLTVVPLVPHV